MGRTLRVAATIVIAVCLLGAPVHVWTELSASAGRPGTQHLCGVCVSGICAVTPVATGVAIVQAAQSVESPAPPLFPKTSLLQNYGTRAPPAA